MHRKDISLCGASSGDVVIKYDYNVKLHSQYLLIKIISEVPHLIMTPYNRHIYSTLTPLHKLLQNKHNKLSILLKLQFKNYKHP